MLRRHACLSVLAAVCGLAAACGDDPPPFPNEPERPAARDRPAPDPAPSLQPPPCPADLAGCRQASGRIVFVERVDPDGDGDAHFVLLSGESVTAPGLTVVDVRRDLRPHPLPEIGNQLGAAGPVFPGSQGQRQIEAVAVRVATR